ncbi:hypothetical protein B0H19DRAFT_1026338 [Mycena capillaripes]|nr:hypothetical protein B0H19DRAFT_1026338 [Mycena capillaripes]
MPTVSPQDPIPSSVEPIPVFNLDTTVGALEVGILASLFLSGVFTVQVWLYFQRYRGDPWGLKFLVGLTWGLDFAHTIAVCHTLYTITVTQYGKPEFLILPPLSLSFAILMSGFIGPLEQGWFTYRLFKLMKTPALPLVCAILALTRFGGIVGLSVLGLSAYPLPEYAVRAGPLIETVVIVSAVLDTILVTSLCYQLSSWRLDRSRVMQKVVNQIITWTIETGALTIVGALGLLIAFLTMKNNFVYIGFFVVIPKQFSNSLLLSLNARNRFAETIRANTHSTAPPSSLLQVEMATLPSPRTTTGSIHFRDSPGFTHGPRFVTAKPKTEGQSQNDPPLDLYDKEVAAMDHSYCSQPEEQ